VGTGNITLYWYALCCLGSGFVFAVAGGLIAYGKWQAKRKKKQRALERAARKAEKAEKKPSASADAAKKPAPSAPTTGDIDPADDDE